jgi:hypothetical protein
MGDRIKLATLLIVAATALGALGVIVYNVAANDWRLDGNPLDLSFLFGTEEDELEPDTDERVAVHTARYGDSVRSVRIETHGLRVQIGPGVGEEITVSLTLSGDATDSTRYRSTFASNAGTLSISAAPTGALGNASGVLEIGVPPHRSIVADVRGGDLAIGAVESSIVLRSSEGSVELAGVRGTLRCRSDGDIRIEACAFDSSDISTTGSIHLHLTDGRVRVEALHVAATSHFGSLDATARGGLAVELFSLGSPLRLVSDTGDVRLRVPDGARFAYDVEAPAGAIISNITFDTLTAAGATEHVLRATMNGGGAPVVIRARRGNVEITRFSGKETESNAPHVEMDTNDAGVGRGALLELPDRSRRPLEGS